MLKGVVVETGGFWSAAEENKLLVSVESIGRKCERGTLYLVVLKTKNRVCQ